MIDTIHLMVQAGDGGKGCESYFHRKDRKIVANGGDGGDGGSIIFRADPNAPPIADLNYRQYIIAESGAHGSGSRKRGKDGEDLIILVPCGTRIYERKRNLLIRHLVRSGEEVTVAEGGMGGKGNHRHRDATLGQKGAIFELEIVLRLEADACFVGLPNSGASSILNWLTRAHVKTENYPFKTRDPELGVCKFSDYEHATLCALPSIYRGSHLGHGVGNDFLKHLEMAKFIFFVLDPCSEFSSTLEEGISILREEIKVYNKEFLEIPYAVIINKIDLPEAREKVTSEAYHFKVPCVMVSAKTGEGMDLLRDFIMETVKESKNGL